jgi:hypothetical protein
MATSLKLIEFHLVKSVQMTLWKAKRYFGFNMASWEIHQTSSLLEKAED